MLFPSGRFRAVAVPVSTDNGDVWAQFGRSKNAGSEQVVVNFEFLEGEAAGKIIAWFGYFSEKTADKTMEGLRNCGWKGEDILTAAAGPLDQEVSIVVEHEKDQEGKPRAKVRWVNRPGGGGGLKLESTMDQKDLRMFAAKLKTKAKAIKEVDGEKANRDAVSAPIGNSSGSAEDPLPF